MRLVKFEHACVRVESDGAVLVIDPGMFTTRAALDGVDAVLFTHEHPDHLNVDALADELAKRPAVQVFTNDAVAAKLSALSGAVTIVDSGQTFTAAGFQIKAYGGWHAEIHPEVERVRNLGYLIENSVYHPGDSFDVPEEANVEALFVPISAPWLKAAESIEFVRAVAPRYAFALHDHLLSQAGYSIFDGVIGRLCHADYRRLGTGETVTV